MEPRDFRPTAEQRRLLEGRGLDSFIVNGRLGSRTHATELFIVATAANEEEAKLALEDLHTRGIALLSSDGKRVEPGSGGRRRRFAAVKFDEERPTMPCLDCDEAGCEKCGGTGRRRA